MSIRILRPLSPTERILKKRLETIETVCRSLLVDNAKLRGKIESMIGGEEWEMRLVRKLVLRWERRKARRSARAAASPDKSGSVGEPAQIHGTGMRRNEEVLPPSSAQTRPSPLE